MEVCIFKFENDRPWYLLLHRAKGDKIYPGIWQFVTGSIEGNERAIDAATREVHEETGLKETALWVVPYVNSFYDPGWDALNLCPLFAVQVQQGVRPALSSEHDDYRWLLYEDAVKKLVWPGQKKGMQIVQEYIVRGEIAAKLTQVS